MNKERKKILVQSGLFIATIVTTTIAGAEWMYGRFLFWTEESMSWSDFVNGFQYSVPFLLILTCHEFGHYFTARYHRIGVTLPYYIPLWLGFIVSPSFGTMGAFIRIKEVILSRKHYFDVGISGPLAGFIVAIGFIWFGFTHLPEHEYVFQIHPEYQQYGLDYANYVYQDKETYSFRFGDNIIYWFFKEFVADPDRMPHANEIIHYPLLLAGYLALFFTALNLLPIGQLDGGHIIFGLLGAKNHRLISRILFTVFLFYAGLGMVSIDEMVDSSVEGVLNFLLILGAYLYFLYLSAYSMFEGKRERLLYASILLTGQFLINFYLGWTGYSGWLVFAFLLGRVLGVKHPDVIYNEPLSMERKVLGWLALLIFVLSFSPEPFILEISTP